MSLLGLVCAILMVAGGRVESLPSSAPDNFSNSDVQKGALIIRRSSSMKLVARSPQKAKDDKKEVKKEKAVQAGDKEGAKFIQKEAVLLAKVIKEVDEAVLIIQNPSSTPEAIKKAAEDAVKLEDSEDFPREALASAARDPVAAQGPLAIIRDQGPIVVGAFQEIAKNSADKAKVQEELKKIVLARLQVVPANLNLIGGSNVGNRRLISKLPIGPSETAIGNKVTDPAQRKVVEEAQNNLATQTKIVDEQVAIIEKQGSKPEEIEEAAKKALVQEAGEEFPREVLASAATDPKAAMAALAAVRDHGPSEVVAGFKQIAENSKDAAAVKKGLDLVVAGRKHVVPANLLLIQLAGGSAAAK